MTIHIQERKQTQVSIEENLEYQTQLAIQSTEEANANSFAQVASKVRRGKLVLEDGTTFEGISFGAHRAMAGEVVFSTGMVGYPEAFTDPSFTGQILTMTYPLIGNYGVPVSELWEDDHIHIAGLVVSNYIDTPSHVESIMTLGEWLKSEGIPALEIKDTRRLTQHLRTHGTMLGKMVFDHDIPFVNPNETNLVERVSTGIVKKEGQGTKTVALIDCGAKRNIVRMLTQRGVQVVTMPWDWDLFSPETDFAFDAIVVSNGPGNPKMALKTIETLKIAMQREIPVLGICLGNQLLALAAGGDTYKLKFGHRSQNQPCIMQDSKRCYITTQNHGFAVGTVPPNFQPWFTNANDGSNEGIKHTSLPFMSVQFHPEANPGPLDTEWIFDYFLEKVK